MAEFNIAEVRQWIAERGVGKKEAQKIWWEKLVEFLIKENVEMVSRDLLEQINEECSGFKFYVLGKYFLVVLPLLFKERDMVYLRQQDPFYG